VGQQKTPLGAQAAVSYCLPSCLVRVSENYSFYEEAVFVCDHRYHPPTALDHSVLYTSYNFCLLMKCWLRGDQLKNMIIDL